MFLRQHGRVRNGKEHSYWSLVETVRTADGPRQRTLCYLGELNGSAHARWQKTVGVLRSFTSFDCNWRNDWNPSRFKNVVQTAS